VSYGPSKTARRVPLVRRFWNKVEKSDGCWLWTSVRTPKGYGTIWREGTLVRASRVAWELTYGAIPDGLFVCPHCDNPKTTWPTR
jgi:hypothetical protein